MIYWAVKSVKTGKLVSFSGTRVSSSSPRLYTTKGKAEGAQCHKLFNILPDSLKYDKTSPKGDYVLVQVELLEINDEDI